MQEAAIMDAKVVTPGIRDAVIREAGVTKDAKAVLKALGVEGRCTIVVDDDNVNAFLSFRNIPTVDIVPSGSENTYELLDNKFLIFEETALRKLEEAMA